MKATTFTESNTPNLDRLREHVRTLNGLLNDPHPGLHTWVSAYAAQMQAINDFWREGEDDSNGNS